ncbi:MAG TPA: hypothetical protein VKE93_08205 [Candidatus Angelobacter sp.]|nr:hypothetical protein [Candidatus Angelobacter sp.]
MTTAAMNLTGLAEFWRVARRLHSVYAALDHTFELGTPACPELEQNVDRPEPAVLESVCKWFESIDAQVQVWQLRQLLQSTNLQNEENLRYLIARHLEKKQKTDSDKEKIDFLLVQYFAHCAPPGADQNVTLDAVAGVLEPALGERPEKFPEKTTALDEKLRKMSECDSLEALQESGALTEAREVKAAAGEHSFDPAFLVAFTRFNFLARRAFFRAMHLDLHAVRAAVNELERLGVFSVDCRAAGLSDSESLEQVRHLIHQWKTPFRAPYSGSSFQQLIQMRQALNQALSAARSAKEAPAAKSAPPAKPASAPAPEAPAQRRAEPAAVPSQAGSAPSPVSKASPATPPAARAAAPPAVAPPKPPAAPAAQQAVSHEERTEEDDFLQRCLADIAEQLAAMPARNSPGVSTIHLAGCKLMIATWEAEAFRGAGEIAGTMQRAVAARTILHVCIDRTKKKEATDLGLALEIARRQIEEMRTHVTRAKEANNIDAAVNLAATAKRLLALVDEGEKLHG